jgi:hypothetical protein
LEPILILTKVGAVPQKIAASQINKKPALGGLFYFSYSRNHSAGVVYPHV